MLLARQDSPHHTFSSPPPSSPMSTSRSSAVLQVALLLLLGRAASLSSAGLSSPRLAATNALLDRAFGTTTYADRCRIGRVAQLGGDGADDGEMRVYRPGLIGGGSGAMIDGSRTYGEYDLELFATLVDRYQERAPLPHEHPRRPARSVNEGVNEGVNGA